MQLFATGGCRVMLGQPVREGLPRDEGEGRRLGGARLFRGHLYRYRCLRNESRGHIVKLTVP